jgi:AcrR family transcriptional regulator
MAQNAPTAAKRCRGRPQVRSDDETRHVIYDAARREFADKGYAATSIEAVAREAGVSTKTLYRLIPNKAALFEGTVTDRLERFLSDVNLHASDHTNIDDALFAALMAVVDLALTEEVVSLQRMVLQETGKSSDVAGVFYQNGIKQTAVALTEWLRVQQRRGLIAVPDVEEAAGMLIGMAIAEPQRAAIFGNVPLPSRPQIEARIRRCVGLFLDGCRPKSASKASPA